ncbi:MAG: hypothetical protein R2909_19550 [Gemmatimonadales bacterium]
MRRSLLPLAPAVLALGCGGSIDPPPEAAELVALTARQQSAPAGGAVNEPPAVRVVDATGRPVPEAEVSFVPSSGSIVEPARGLTDADGVARVIRWVVPAGPASLDASVPGAPSIRFEAEGGPRAFDLVIRWLEPPPPEAVVAAAAAEALLESIIWADLPDESVVATEVCRVGGDPVATIDETIDDVLVLARVGEMDGPGGAGAQGFPCLLRDPGTQTIVGFVRLDRGDFVLIDQDRRREFFLHELVHALGLVPGVISISTPSGFTRDCLQQPSRGAPDPLVLDTHFSCAGARHGFDQVGGVRYPGAKVPLENGATVALTANTLNHHWRKSSFGNELMTGWFTAGVRAPLSVVTVGALEDLGYGVSYAAAEAFVLDGPISTAPVAAVPLVERAAIAPPAILGRSR